MEYYLIIDTSNKYLALGIANEEKVLAKVQYYAWQQQSELAVKEIASLLNQCNLSPKAITAIMVTIGPGSYTGVRIGLTIAKVWAFANKLPIIPISSLQALAGLNENVMSLIDARSNRVYVGFYNNGLATKPDSIMEIAEIAKIIDKYQAIGDLSLFNRADEQGDLIEKMFTLIKSLPKVDDAHQVKPIYLKD